MNNFEDVLEQLSKPTITNLKHTDLLQKELVRAKDKSMLSVWWLLVPLYLIIMFLMKSFYMPSYSLMKSIDELKATQPFFSILIFIIIPIIFLVINLNSILKIYKLFGQISIKAFIKTTWLNLMLILFFLIIILLYIL